MSICSCIYIERKKRERMYVSMCSIAIHYIHVSGKKDSKMGCTVRIKLTNNDLIA